jgi:hypothetical protein
VFSSADNLFGIKGKSIPSPILLSMIGVVGFEPTTTCTPFRWEKRELPLASFLGAILTGWVEGIKAYY